MKFELKSSDQIQRETRAAYLAKLRGMSQDEVCEEAMRLYVAVAELENYPEYCDRLQMEIDDLKAGR